MVEHDISSEWFNAIKPSRTAEFQRKLRSLDNLSRVLDGLTLSYFFETVRTIAQYKEPDLWWSLTWSLSGSTQPNFLEPVPTIAQDYIGTWHVVEIDISSEWFNAIEPSRTTELQRKLRSRDNLSWVWGGSTLQNLLEPVRTITEDKETETGVQGGGMFIR